jgi:hypothetical protein
VRKHSWCGEDLTVDAGRTQVAWSTGCFNKGIPCGTLGILADYAGCGWGNNIGHTPQPMTHYIFKLSMEQVFAEEQERMVPKG